MMHARAAQGRQREDEVLLTMDSTPMIGILLALIAMLVMAVPPARHLVEYGQGGCTLSFGRTTDVSYVDIDFDGSLQWNGKAVTTAQLEDYFQGLTKDKDSRHDVHLRASRTTTYQQVMTVLALTQRYGLTSVSVVNGGMLS
ncbi:hypothetical protein UNDKW_4278 [Undibacterium sp. KW1]|uniref:ExbD/TolR family protein n=1 Tax=Undibacterium sp. KW1 TaxID=2058624 RepID=UPI001331CEAD|nr:biopolymer transporter ExbD [Undibacterium sp. KW1]BBB62551.1 hypothetical protein UNDKW_4278 [Undibacterium sp. KW1]